MEKYLLDTNIIRFLTKDDKSQSPSSTDLFRLADEGALQLLISPFVLAECSWVLRGEKYQLTRAEVSDKLVQLIKLKGVKTLDRKIVEKPFTSW